MLESIWMQALAMVLGVLTHVFAEIRELRQIEGNGFHMKHYLVGYPYRNLGMVTTAIGAFFLMQESGQLSFAAAFAAGYTVESLANKFSDRVSKVT
jgi:hypothetical protein